MNKNIQRPLNAREKMIKKGYNAILFLCGLMLLNIVPDLLEGNYGEFVVQLVILLLFCWALYSGQSWIRYIWGVYSLLNLLGSAFMMVGYLASSEVLTSLIFLIPIATDVMIIYLLFFYEPIQAYLRYIGAKV